ncbi:DMT family transporter [Clostridium grantii]|uniref:Permease of the drug/metabolite transporter (DMT) superfamily n=1 Tax=Clostridium grantii DSM 8605 TaxID=1121316 RepID=A0A1M5RTN7_9CLOT|nr:DMT family transporter [Clostridium grantii]SHH29521.1 Permease of the drug/metabolite transporter (DMT) superfamily [Clostridium grantii DSM 8605]
MDSKKFLTKKSNVIILAIFCSILWGSAFPTLKVSYIELSMNSADMIGKIVLAGMRFFIAAIMIFLFLIFVLKKSIKISKSDIIKLLILGLIQTTFQYFFFYTGVSNTTGSKSSILTSVGSFIVVIIAHFYYKDDRINKEKSIGLILGFIGIVIINLGNGFNVDFNFYGEGFIIISTTLGSVGTIMAKELSKTINPFVITAWQMLLGATILLIFGLPQLSPEAITFTLKGWILLIYAAILSATAFSLWYSLLKYNKAGEISIYKFVIPVSGSILSIMFLEGEVFTINTFIALILVSLGIMAINYKKS